MFKIISRTIAVGILAIASIDGRAIEAKPTILLVHGAFADSSSWNGVVSKLIASGFTVIAAANPLRGVANDAEYVASLARSVSGPVVLVGHSYGGAVISAAANGLDNVKALVFVAAFAPDRGETALALAGKFPGSTLGSALAAPVELPNGGKDLYVQQSKFPEQFAADVPLAQAKAMAAIQRPIKAEALQEASHEPAWKSIPSWAIYGTADRNIPPQAMKFMAERAGARKTVVIADASHALMVSHPVKVAALIQEAAAN